MSLNIETTQGLERRVTITVPAETVVQAIREELKRVAKNARIDGFRKGKVPPHIIEKRFGASRYFRRFITKPFLPSGYRK